MPLEMALGRGRISVVAIPHGVPQIGGSKGLEDIGVHPGVVVTGKTAGRLHGSTI
jgi:hypothetical protein